MSIRVAVIGLGRVGAGYQSSAGVVRNHLDAIRAIAGLEIVALVDPDRAARARVARRHPDLEPMLRSSAAELQPRSIDFAVIAAPVDTRMPTVTAAIAAGARLIFCEKPLAGSATIAQELLRKTADAGVSIRVNFHRRFDPGMSRFRALSDRPPIAVQARYGKGLFNYGSHLVDLLMDWCGKVNEARAIGEPDGRDDLTVSFALSFASGATALVLGVPQANWDVLDIDFLFPDMRIELLAGGAERRLWRVSSNLHYENYVHLRPDVAASETSPLGGLTEFYGAARDYLNDGVPLGGCDGDTALAGIEVLHAIGQSAIRNGVSIKIQSE